jgi:hypothetical protein
MSRIPIPAVILVAFSAFGQSTTGTIEKLSKDQLQVKTPSGLLTFGVDENTAVNKGKTLHDISALVVGDEVRISYYGEQVLTAVNITARTSISGVITEAGATRLVVHPDSSGSAPILVFLDRATKVIPNRTQIAVGRGVRVEGWDAGNGAVEAGKIAILNAR